MGDAKLDVEFTVMAMTGTEFQATLKGTDPKTPLEMSVKGTFTRGQVNWMVDEVVKGTNSPGKKQPKAAGTLRGTVLAFRFVHPNSSGKPISVDTVLNLGKGN
jgi:hypothetical protein